MCSKVWDCVTEGEFSVTRWDNTAILELGCTCIFGGFLILGLVVKTSIWEGQKLQDFVCASLLEYWAYQILGIIE